MKILFAIIFSLFVIFNSNAQSGNPDSVGVYNLTVISTPDKAQVYIDTTMIGKTPIHKYTLNKGTYTLKIINPV